MDNKHNNALKKFFKGYLKQDSKINQETPVYVYICWCIKLDEKESKGTNLGFRRFLSWMMKGSRDWNGRGNIWLDVDLCQDSSLNF